MKRKAIMVALLAVMAQPAVAATPTNWVTTYDAATYGSSGTVTFNDWGYKGPTGVGANDFQVGSGFDAARVGQMQNVMTVTPDLKTPDPSHLISRDFSVDEWYPDANMDGQVNFFKWAYTTPTSTFNNMKIDKAGNYFVEKNDMTFGFYDQFNYHDNTGTYADEVFDTNINFKPYAISDAKGWCGSSLLSNPAALENMAGQVTFDFAFDAYTNNLHAIPGETMIQAPGAATQVVPGFVMRSYGDYTVQVGSETYTGSAVMNNTNPETGALDPDYQNKVSFLGGGVVPKGVWVFNNGTADVTVANDQAVQGTSDGQIRLSDGAVWHVNSFAGYAFLLRADAERTLTFLALDGHSDYVTTDAAAYVATGQVAATPIPGAALLLGSGLLGMAGVIRRKKLEKDK